MLKVVPELERHGWRFVFWVPGHGPLWSHLEDRGYDVAGEPRCPLQPGGAGRSAGSSRTAVEHPGLPPAFPALAGGPLARPLHANTLLMVPEALAATRTGVPVLL